MSRSRRQPSGADSFEKLSEGVKYGLQRLVNENAETVKQMLSANKTASATELCELCAQVMQQQQPSAAMLRCKHSRSPIDSSSTELPLRALQNFEAS